MKYIVKKRKTLNERIMDAYDRGYRDGYKVGTTDWALYEHDMEIMREERKEVGTL